MTTYDGVTGAVATHDVFSDPEQFEGDTLLIDTVSYDAILNTATELSVTIDLHDEFNSTYAVLFSNENGEFDSGTVVEAEDSQPSITYDLYRTDDGTDVLLRSYLISSLDGGFEQSTYFYKQAVSDSRELPLLGATLKGANPTSPGSEIMLEGLPSSANLEIYDAQGRLISKMAGYQNGKSITWPQTQAGVYYLTCHAQGFAPHAWPIVSQ